MAPTVLKPILLSFGVALAVCLKKKKKRKAKIKIPKRWLVNRKKYATKAYGA